MNKIYHNDNNNNKIKKYLDCNLHIINKSETCLVTEFYNSIV